MKYVIKVDVVGYIMLFAACLLGDLKYTIYTLLLEFLLTGLSVGSAANKLLIVSQSYYSMYYNDVLQSTFVEQQYLSGMYITLSIHSHMSVLVVN